MSDGTEKKIDVKKTLGGQLGPGGLRYQPGREHGRYLGDNRGSNLWYSGTSMTAGISEANEIRAVRGRRFKKTLKTSRLTIPLMQRGPMTSGLRTWGEKLKGKPSTTA